MGGGAPSALAAERIIRRGLDGTFTRIDPERGVVIRRVGPEFVLPLPVGKGSCGTPIGADVARQIAELRRDGWTLQRVADFFGVSLDTVNKYGGPRG